MKIRYLLLGTSLSFLPTLSFAQCVATQDCATLGYTETSCNGGKGVKCPFGNKWACFQECPQCETCISQETICADNGFIYTCKGIGYTGGSGKDCNGKYVECSCDNGYKWKDNRCQEILNGAVGDVYKCNGNIIAVKSPNSDFYVALNDLSPEPITWKEAKEESENYIFCENIKGNLPTSAQLAEIYSELPRINSALSKNKGTDLKKDWYWSSTQEVSSYRHYIINMANGKGEWSINQTNLRYLARAILTSW